MQTPISAEEMQSQLAYVDRAFVAATPEEAEGPVIEALLAYGHRFGHTLKYLADDSQDHRLQRLFEVYTDLLGRWIGGEQLTDRADENQRRAAAAVAIAEQQPGLGALAAKAVLALPEGDPHRDVALARRLLEAYEVGEGDVPSAEKDLSVLTRLIDLEEPRGSELDECVERGLALEREVEEPTTRRRFRVAATGRYLRLAIAARDEDDDAEAQHRLAARGVELLEGFPPDAGLMGLLAALYTVLDDDRRAAETFGRAVEDDEAQDSTRLMAAQFEARVRLGLGELERVVELLEPRVEEYERQYLTAVADEDVESEGETFGDVTMNLAFAHAQLGDWAHAVAVLDRGKSRRSRYRAALRSTAEGAEILERERELYASARGATHRPPAVPDAHVDPLAAGVTPHAALLEAYRTLRPRLETDVLATPSLADIAAVLRPDEAALMLGQRSEAMLLAAVLPGDSTTPRIGRIVPFPTDRWAVALAPPEGYGWATALAAGAGRAETAAALRGVLEFVDEFLRDVVDDLYADGVRSLVVIPHRWLHLVPYWAVPSLARLRVETAPSAAALVSARGRPVPRLGSSALVVVPRIAANHTHHIRRAGAVHRPPCQERSAIADSMARWKVGYA